MLEPTDPLKDWLRNKFDRQPIAVSFWAIFGLIGLAAVIRNGLQWIGLFDLMMHNAVVVKVGPPIEFHVKGWFFWIFASLTSLAAVAIAVLIQREFKLQQAKTELVNVTRNKDERSTIAFKTFQRTMWVATKIRDQHQPLAPKLRKSYRSIEGEYRISKDSFDVEFSSKSEIFATVDPVNFFTFSVIAASAACPMEYLDDIGFKMKDESGKDVVYQQTENDPRSKKIIVYPIPRIEPGEPPRTIYSTYKWPGMFKDLGTLRAEPFSWSAESLSDIKKIQFTFLFEKGTGDELVCEALKSSQFLVTGTGLDMFL